MRKTKTKHCEIVRFNFYKKAFHAKSFEFFYKKNFHEKKRPKYNEYFKENIKQNSVLFLVIFPDESFIFNIYLL